jgi:hypothetical protein
MSFFVHESCGYCTPCRVGNVFLQKAIQKFRKGLANPEDIDYLKDLSGTIIETSRCGLGMTSPNPVLSTLENFPLVYSAMVKPARTGSAPPSISSRRLTVRARSPSAVPTSSTRISHNERHKKAGFSFTSTGSRSRPMPARRSWKRR